MSEETTVIDGSRAPMGRLASHVAKKALKGEEVAVVNCQDVVITGNKSAVHKEFGEKRNKTGSTQQGPRHRRKAELIVKRTIRGMLPDHRQGRGREAWRRIKCYKNIPHELEGKDLIKLDTKKRIKETKVNELEK